MPCVQLGGATKEVVRAAVQGARSAIASSCSIPITDIVGFRQPFLESGPTVREVGGCCRMHADGAATCSLRGMGRALVGIAGGLQGAFMGGGAGSEMGMGLALVDLTPWARNRFSS